jgi:excisionase family DNA binding protein
VNAAERFRQVPPERADDLLTVPEAATRLGCGRTKVFALIKARELPSVKVGRARQIRRGDVDAYLDRQF